MAIDKLAAVNIIELKFAWNSLINPFSRETTLSPISILICPNSDKLSSKVKCALENFAESRLPHFTQTEIDNLKGSADFFGLNHYHTGLCSHVEFPISDSPAYFKDLGVKVVPDPNWKPNQNIVPWGFYKLLRWVAKEYNNPLVYVTENGYGDSGQEGLLDTDRIVFLKGFLKALLQAVQEGCNVQKYTVWSLMDNLEWTQGYTVKFGLYKVDFNSPNRTRTPRASARLYKYVIKTGTIPNKTDFFLNN
ncbi:hypothetical protein HHI36_024043 [Cryptolaemus montrouzieri]|uniref:Beta-glucosidase n=1 Tax=Cryptolaemus montrouzieri TaxID=559131 RepID=A0ABD2MW64_9CUCU